MEKGIPFSNLPIGQRKDTRWRRVWFLKKGQYK